MNAKAPFAGLQPIDAREVSSRDCKPARVTYACMLQVLEACQCRLLLFVTPVELGHKCGQRRKEEWTPTSIRSCTLLRTRLCLRLQVPCA